MAVAAEAVHRVEEDKEKPLRLIYHEKDSDYSYAGICSYQDMRRAHTTDCCSAKTIMWGRHDLSQWATPSLHWEETWVR